MMIQDLVTNEHLLLCSHCVMIFALAGQWRSIVDLDSHQKKFKWHVIICTVGCPLLSRQKWCRTGHYEIRQWQLGQWDPTIQISLVKITQYFRLLVNKTIHLLNKLHIFWDRQKRGFRIFPRNRGFGAFFDCISFYDIFSSGVHFWRRRKWLLWPKWSDWVIFTAQFFRFYSEQS